MNRKAEMAILQEEGRNPKSVRPTRRVRSLKPPSGGSTEPSGEMHLAKLLADTEI